MTVKLGTNPIAWTNDDMPELGGDTPLETCLREAAEAGFVGIEKGGKFPNEAAAVKRVLAPFGLELVSGWWSGELRTRSVEAEIRAMQAHFDLLKGCGCPVMVWAETAGTVQGRRDVPVADRPVMGEDEWPGYLERIGKLADWMAANGVRMAFHHHMGTVIEKAHEIDRLLAGTPDSVGLLFDTGHLTFAGDDPAAVARKWAGRINHVHTKDVRPDVLRRAREERWSFLDSVLNGVYTVPGDGCIDFVAALQPIADAGYSGWVICEAEQDPAKAHPLTYARKGYATLKATLEQVGLKLA
ncbi:MAG: myo-inosose-2 dehydratase [Geminicoccaceae bacterium]